LVSAATKRERLVGAARSLIHRQGYHRTTLADIAAKAEVPLGNVYYYFRTKDDLLQAVVDEHAEELRAKLAAFAEDQDPRGRLKALIRSGADLLDLTASYGCPHGSLCQELDKQDGGQESPTARLLRLRLEWAEEQFRLLGKGEQAHELAIDLIAALQGASLLTNAFHAPQLMLDKTRRLEAWIDAGPPRLRSDA
jgi:TetR/AcrR family transcriptional regulator, transcriptional repressor for nem operon